MPYFPGPGQVVQVRFIRCTAHKNIVRECTALDYANHTLDNLTEILLEQKEFLLEPVNQAEIDGIYEKMVRRMLRIIEHGKEVHSGDVKRWRQRACLEQRIRGFSRKFGLSVDV